MLRSRQPVSGEDLQLILERNGYPEECYFTFSYSPILDRAGAPVGVFTIVTEATRQGAGRTPAATGPQPGCGLGDQAGTMVDTCRAMLAFLPDPADRALRRAGACRTRPIAARGVAGSYGLAADAWSLGMPTDGYQDEAAVIDRVMQTGQGEMLTGLRDSIRRRSCPDRSVRWSRTRRW